MNQTSSFVTGGVTLSAASLVPAVQWSRQAARCQCPLKCNCSFAGAIVTGIHAVRKLLAARKQTAVSVQQ